MKKILWLLPLIFVLSCSSATYIKTLPSGAKVYESDALMGVTPYMHWDIDSGDPGNPDYPGRTFTLKKDGYKDKTITIKRNILNVPRLFFPAPIFSLPWAYDYPYEYYFELESTGKRQVPFPHDSVNRKGFQTDDKPYSAASRKLLELKALYEEDLVTDEEYQTKRKDIIDDM